MYRIIGSDQKEYGPVTADQLRQWIAQGRVNAQTQIKPEGGADWQSLGTVPEFAAEVSPPAAPPASASAPAVRPKTSGMAVTSLVLGILGSLTCGLTAVAGLVLGIVALVKIKNSQGRLSGQGLAIAGTAVSGLFTLMLPIFAALLLPALASAKQKAQCIKCANNVRQLSLALRMYASDHKDMLPTATNWCDRIAEYVGPAQPFQCPSGNPNARSHYALNAKLADVSDGDIRDPAQTVMLFESDAGWNASGGAELLPAPSRHRRVVIVGFADGHVEQIAEARLEQLRWDP